MDFPLAIPEQMSQQLRSLRKAKGLSQVQLAQMMGVTQSRIAAIERDATKLKLHELYKLLSLLDAELVVRNKDRTLSATAQATTNFHADLTVTPKGEW
jgi:HTH-type transcriptional regulator/antitoxin HipB